MTSELRQELSGVKAAVSALGVQVNAPSRIELRSKQS